MHSVRKVCESMSTKRYILILLFSCLILNVFSIDDYYFSFEFQNADTDNDTDNKFYESLITVDKDLNQYFSFYLLNQFHDADYLNNEDPERLNNYLSTKLDYKNNIINTNLAYDIRYFDHQNFKGLFPEEVNGPSKRNVKHQFTYSLDLQNDYFYIDQAIRYSSMDYTRRKKISGVTNYFDEKDQNIYYSASLNIPVYNKLSIITLYDLKKDISDNKNYSMQFLTTGFNFNHRFDMYKNIELQSTMTWRDSDYLLYDKVLTQYITYQHRFTHNINTFLTYTNRSVYDSSNQEFLLISNYLRAQAKYAFDYDTKAESYFILGAKYSEENEANAFFTTINMLALSNVYLSYHIQYYQDKSMQNKVKALWYFMPQSYFYTAYELFNDKTAESKSNLLTTGATLHF